MSFEYKIATAAAGVSGLTLLSALGVTFPASDPSPYSVELPLGSGGVRGLGWATVRWHWGVYTVEEWDALRAYCPEKSADVVIRTLDVDDNQAWTNYSAVMVWPTGRPWFVHGRKAQDLTILFQALVEIP